MLNSFTPPHTSSSLFPSTTNISFLTYQPSLTHHPNTITTARMSTMTYAPFQGTPEDFTVSQSRDDGSCGSCARCCDDSGPWGVDIFAGCIGGIAACFAACCEGLVGCCQCQ
ncbi:hypothetical protein P280DRAFT_60210 [Massarina eburnea CBS 473.64]|uniref:Uncharacterized protein n=1 Tax=Massarina eburnea CBS 473.64 TaxID=1395130 RepID=A0A6A6RY69_9PLEO|nr:hypothetical protein P280DRAFT_60210 [Massarina eburnea CBS 473.64]